jgi:CRP/FNR family transcriptional regulator
MLKPQLQTVTGEQTVRFNPALRANNVEPLLKETSCKPCSILGLCVHGGNAQDPASAGHLGEQMRPLHKGDYLFRQGEKARNIYVIRSGGVKLLYTSQDGTEQILNFYLRGEILGLGDIESGVHSCSAIALETTGACRLPYEKLQSACLDNPRLYDQLFRIASREIAYEHGKMVLLGQKQSEERFAAFILDLAGRNKKNGYSYSEFNLSMSRHDIAKYLCLADETISRMITKFCSEKLLEVSKRAIRICNHDRLAKKAGLLSQLPLPAYMN